MIVVIDEFDMTIGHVLVVHSNSTLHLGEIVTINTRTYLIKGFLQPSGSYDSNMISILVEPIRPNSMK